LDSIGVSDYRGWGSKDNKTHPYLADFGIAHSPHAEDQALTRPDQQPGTPLYMSPEQWEGKSELISPQTDLYAFGIIIYQLLTGSPPFTGNDRELDHAHCTQPLPESPRYLTPALYRVLARATAKAPEDRYGSAREVVNALQQADLDPDTENLDRLIESYLVRLLRGYGQTAPRVVCRANRAGDSARGDFPIGDHAF
jgi:serine/threonine protein kinase